MASQAPTPWQVFFDHQPHGILLEIIVVRGAFSFRLFVYMTNLFQTQLFQLALVSEEWQSTSVLATLPAQVIDDLSRHGKN